MRPRGDGVRWAAALLLLAYLGFLAFVLGQASPSVAAGVVRRCTDVLVDVGVPAAWTAGGRVELALNALMFAPLSLLAALVLPRHPWANWVVHAFVLSVLVELVQALWLPLRSAQYADVVANTAGALIGALGARALLAGRRSEGHDREQPVHHRHR